MFTPRQHRLRTCRISEVGRIYLITCVCHHRQPLFANFWAGRCVVHGLMAVADVAKTLAYVVMPDHLHWLMQLEEGGDLSEAVQKAKSVASRNLTADGYCRLPVWQRGFHDHGVRREEDLVGLARYVVANPLRAGIAGSVRDYPLWDAVWL